MLQLFISMRARVTSKNFLTFPNCPSSAAKHPDALICLKASLALKAQNPTDMPALPVERTTATFTGNTLAARQMLIIGIHFQRD